MTAELGTEPGASELMLGYVWSTAERGKQEHTLPADSSSSLTPDALLGPHPGPLLGFGKDVSCSDTEIMLTALCHQQQAAPASRLGSVTHSLADLLCP